MILALIVMIVSLMLIILLSIISKKKDKVDLSNRDASLLNLFTKDKKTQQKTQIKTCESCGAIVEVVDGKGKCPYCGAKKIKVKNKN